MFAPLLGDVGDAVGFLNRVRSFAVHPAAAGRDEIAPDFADVEHMQVTYEVFDGIMAGAFERLRDVVVEGATPDPDDALLSDLPPDGATSSASMTAHDVHGMLTDSKTEGGRFELPVRQSDAQRFSRAPHSTTLPPLHEVDGKEMYSALEKTRAADGSR